MKTSEEILCSVKGKQRFWTHFWKEIKLTAYLVGTVNGKLEETWKNNKVTNENREKTQMQT